MGFPHTGLPSQPCTGVQTPLDKEVPPPLLPCLVLGHLSEGILAKSSFQPHSHTWPLREMMELCRVNPPLPLHSQRKRPACLTFPAHPLETSQHSPGGSASGGGSPDNAPRFHRPMGLVDEEGTHRVWSLLNSLWGSKQLQERRAGIPRRLLQTCTGCTRKHTNCP